jgi:hypothetical protein
MKFAVLYVMTPNRKCVPVNWVSWRHPDWVFTAKILQKIKKSAGFGPIGRNNATTKKKYETTQQPRNHQN